MKTLYNLIILSIIILAFILFYQLNASKIFANNELMPRCCNAGQCIDDFCFGTATVQKEPCPSGDVSVSCFDCIDLYYRNQLCSYDSSYQDWFCNYWTGSRWAEYRGGPINYE